MTRIKFALRRLAQDTRGSAVVETMLMLPVMLGIWLVGVAAYDSYRVDSEAVRASYAIADAMSREKEAVNQTYLDNMHELYETMLGTGGAQEYGSSIRVTIACFSERRDMYRVAWSKVIGGSDYDWNAHSHRTLDELSDRLPIMPYGDQVIVLETAHFYLPLGGIVGGDRFVRNFVVTRPRFTNQVRFENQDGWVCKGG